MKGSGRVGRPRAGEKGVPRSVISDREIEQFLKEHPEINASEIFRTGGVRAIMPSLGLDSRIEKVQKEIDDLRADLASKEAVLNQLLREKEQREAMAFEQRLELTATRSTFILSSKKAG
ncbi:hypothetical protein [Thermogymnomonas acidicola]|uniref:hypothetical protein n=1 Tax=Thermogymnomonas acidicola TaxID=399579 RepID=UPI0009461F69|nr:hypothetical protein [Thermogymnomonas acidicola]